MEHSLEAQSAQSAARGQAILKSRQTALWNPRVATCWGLVLSPAFSAWVHMRNWQALGETEKAREAKTWFCMLAGYVVMCCVLAAGSEAFGRALMPPASVSLALLVAWHIWGGRAQERYMAVLTSPDYPRLPWRRVVLGAVGAYAAVVVLIATLMTVLGA